MLLRLPLQLALIATLCLAIPKAVAGSSAHTFSVRDSIEMSRFTTGEDIHTNGDQLAVWFSPDQRYFAVVTSRGLLPSNKMESAIRIFSTGEVRAFLHGGKQPRPRV